MGRICLPTLWANAAASGKTPAGVTKSRARVIPIAVAIKRVIRAVIGPLYSSGGSIRVEKAFFNKEVFPLSGHLFKDLDNGRFDIVVDNVSVCGDFRL